jgi:hypothetical protein
MNIPLKGYISIEYLFAPANWRVLISLPATS